jgi:methylated-DNA-[protein]-cysteine S-methyltransferase
MTPSSDKRTELCRRERRFTFFHTPIGLCGIVWGERGVAGLQFPELTRELALTRIQREFPGSQPAAPPAQLRNLFARLRRLLSGGRVDLNDVPLELSGLPAFHARVYRAVRTIPPGATLSYGEVAALAGAPGAARAVGNALARNPFPLIVPCHRVIGSGGRIGGYSAPGGLATKRRLLTIEGATSSVKDLFGSLSIFELIHSTAGVQDEMRICVSIR